ncbi:MAG: ABC transporter ATP-binding protein [Rhodospirillales bacterium]|nr:ABC transporter ATP-binding protein [Rhodospirillales bacterium]
MGDLSLGALVAVLAAYKDLSSPWKELLDYYQQTKDARIKYDQLAEQFQPAGMTDASLQRFEQGPVPALAGPIVATNVALEEEGGIKVLEEGATVTIDTTQRISIVGPPGSGRAGFLRLLARLLTPTSGSLAVGGRNLVTLPESVVGRRIAFIDQTAHLSSGTIRDNLYYGLKHGPVWPKPVPRHCTLAPSRSRRPSS